MDKTILGSTLITLTAFLVATRLVFIDAELPDEYGVFRIQQKTDCPTVLCPWNCERYIDANGCIFCGRCTQKTSCPVISCPSLPYFECIARVGRDGCTTCKCRVKAAYQVRQNETEVTSVSRPKPEPTSGGRPKPEFPSTSGCPIPMCSQNCRIVRDARGCEKCDCPPRPQTECPMVSCDRSDCWKERGPDGCYYCRCPDDVVHCPEIKCDLKKMCKPVIDHNTGCAVGCRCQQPNDI